MPDKSKRCLVWVIGGAGRGVGKTTLAQRLCEVLPDSVYVKCGHARKKKHKQPNYFRRAADLERFVADARRRARHVVAEYNAWAHEGRGDVTLFVDAAAGRTRRRDDADALSAAADLCVAADSTEIQWRTALARVPIAAALRKKIVSVLAEHRRFVVGGQADVRSKVWFEADGRHVFGAGIASLLECVDELGTLTAAAKATDMSYRYAWDLLRTAEVHFGRAFVARQAGGRRGGRTTLTDDGRHALAVFRQLNQDVARFADKQFHVLVGRGAKHG